MKVAYDPSTAVMAMLASIDPKRFPFHLRPLLLIQFLRSNVLAASLNACPAINEMVLYIPYKNAWCTDQILPVNIHDGFLLSRPLWLKLVEGIASFTR